MLEPVTRTHYRRRPVPPPPRGTCDVCQVHGCLHEYQRPGVERLDWLCRSCTGLTRYSVGELQEAIAPLHERLRRVEALATYLAQ